MDILIYSLIFSPMIMALLLIFMPINIARLWFVSLLISGLNFFGFAWILAQFYLDSVPLNTGIVTHEQHWSSIWGINFQFRIDFLSATLALVFSLIFLLNIVMARQELLRSKAKLAGLFLFYTALIGIFCASEFPMAVVFLAALFFTELLLFGWDMAPHAVATLKKHTFIAALSTGLFLVCVLAFSKPFSGSMSKWFLFSGSEYELGFRHFIFLVFCVAVFLRTPIFPFQSRLGCLYKLDSLAHLLPILCTTNIGFYLLFRYGPGIFPLEFMEFSPVIAWLATIHILYSILYLARNSGHREHIYGTQQLWNGILLLGFISLGIMGWVGAWSLYIMEILVIALALFIAIAIERRGNKLGRNSTKTTPAYAAASLFGSMALLGAPITSAFYSNVLIFWSAIAKHKYATYPILIALPILLWIGVRRLFFQHSGIETQGDLVTNPRELDHAEIAVIFILCALILICGLYPDLLFHPIGMQIDQIWAALNFSDRGK